MAVSLKDVARASGVSIKTVSNVVNDYPFVSPGTRFRVQAAISELGYRPNLSARRLRAGRSGLIALSLPEISAPYFAELADQVVVAAEREGLTVLIDKTGGERGHEQLVAAGIRDNLIDGTIASSLAMSAQDVEGLRGRHPVVLLGERLAHVDVDHVAVDSVAAAHECTAHLLAGGRRRIAVIGTLQHPTATATAALRLRGYRDALAGAGLSVDPTLQGEVEGYHRLDGHAAMLSLLERRPDLDAVFCFNDLLAIGAMLALRAAGRLIPGDVAVVGFDDIAECQYTAPPLTSLAPDKQALAEVAVRLLAARIRSTEPIEAQEISPPYVLNVRESSAGVAGAD